MLHVINGDEELKVDQKMAEMQSQTNRRSQGRRASWSCSMEYSPFVSLYLRAPSWNNAVYDISVSQALTTTA